MIRRAVGDVPVCHRHSLRFLISHPSLTLTLTLILTLTLTLS